MGRTFQVSLSIPATTTQADAISAAGINAFFGKASGVTFYSNGAAIGLTQALTADDGTEGVQVIPAGSAIGVASTVGKIKTNEDFVIQFAVAAGFKLLWAVTNTTAGAIIVQGLFVVA